MALLTSRILLLVDIGNRFAHIYNGVVVINLEHSEFLKRYKEHKLYYINVNLSIQKQLEKNINWINLEPYIRVDGSYDGMGVDRKALLLSRDDGLYVDCGSAITIDLKEGGRFVGGTILPGIWRVKSCYKEISPRLEVESISKIDVDNLPNSTTNMSISYGIIAPIIALVDRVNYNNLPIYCCGGDGELLSNYLGGEFDDLLVFKGMQKVIKECGC